MLQIFILLSQHIQWFQRLLHNISLNWNFNLSFPWDPCSDTLLGLLNLPYYLICVRIDLKHTKLHALSQYVTDGMIHLLILKIPSKEGSKSRMQLFNKFDESRKTFLLKKSSVYPLLDVFQNGRNFFKYTGQGRIVEFNFCCSPLFFIFKNNFHYLLLK